MSQSLRDKARQAASRSKPNAKPATSAPEATRPRKKEPMAYYDSSRGTYWTKNQRGEWIQLTEASLRRRLKYEKFGDVADKEILCIQLDQELMRMQFENDVAYAGAIAGYRTGLHDVAGQRILVTNGPRLIVPAPGEWKTLRAFIEALLLEQKMYFYAWLKCACRTLYAGPPFRPGQMVAIAGPAGCGKSLLQNLITEIFGGRTAKPYRYLIGDTAFNSDLMQNEHLMIEDEAASTELRVRRHFGSQLKNLIVNETQSMHRKGRDAFTVTPFTRVTITLNDEPENMMVLPPLDESLRDKITLLRGHEVTFPYGADDLPARNRYRAVLSLELPAFMHWLRGYRIPDRLANQRYGCVAYQEETLLKELAELAPEVKLLSIIDSLWIFGEGRMPWEGKAGELEAILLDKDRTGRIKQLFSWNNACGSYLGRLAKLYPSRVTVRRTGEDNRIWKVTPPY